MPGTRIFVTIEGERQGKFRSEGGPQFRDRIPAIRYQYEVVAPRDPTSGQATGKRQYKPVLITKEWSVASPQIAQAVATNENLKSVLIEFFRAAPQTGQEEAIATVRLTNAHVSRFVSSVSDPASGDSTAGRLVDHVEFAFDKIEITNPAGKTQAVDSWVAPQ
jgi:type VI secretion system secreted protein Hcp